MSITKADEERLSVLSPAERDQWWLVNVYRGSAAQLTARAALTGMVLGSVLCMTNLYIGMKTSMAFGVGITAVILAGTSFHVISRFGLGRELSILENNAVQTIASAAGYVPGVLVSSLPAYMLVTGRVIPWWQSLTWIAGLGLLGVLFAIPLKRRLLNEQQLPFPEGRATAVVLQTLHGADARQLFIQGRWLAVAGGLAAAWELCRHVRLLQQVRLGFLDLPRKLESAVQNVVEALPSIGSTRPGELGVVLNTDSVLVAVGGMVGIRTAASLMLGAVLNYLVVAPIMISRGYIQGVPNPATGTVHFGYARIAPWSLWTGVAMMTVAALVSFFARPRMLASAFARRSQPADTADDALRPIELPRWLFWAGVPLVGAGCAVMACTYFNVAWWVGLATIPMAFLAAVIGAQSTALTSFTPTGTLAKLTQATFGVLRPGNVTTNLAAAGMVGTAVSNCSSFLTELKPGYLLGASPRKQAVGHLLGILAGASASIALFYTVIVRDGLELLGTPDYPFPAAMMWKSLSELFTQGLSVVPNGAAYGALAGAIVAGVIEVANLGSQKRIPLSAVGIGLAFLLPFSDCLSIFVGAAFFWLAGRLSDRKVWSALTTALSFHREALCAGAIAGGAVAGMAAALLERWLPR